MRATLGIDIGTQSVKAGLFDFERGRLTGVIARDYPGTATQSPDTIWGATAAAVRECVERHPDAEIMGVGLSGQMHGTVMYGADGNVLGDIINWQDGRCNRPSEKFEGRTTIEEMGRRMGSDGFYDLGIDAMASGFFGATLFHIKEHEPELFGRVVCADLPTDFVRRRLTGGPSETDPTNAFSSGLFDTRNGVWHEDFIVDLDLPISIFPRVRPTCDVAGRVTREAAGPTGLKEGIPVVTGGGDNPMSVIGTGIAGEESPPLLNIGTGSQINLCVGEYIKIAGTDTRPLLPGKYILVGAGLTGGKSYTWLRDAVAGDAEALGNAVDKGGLFRRMDALAEEVGAGSDGLRFEPFLRGTRRDHALRGSFGGIAEDNFTLGHRARAVMEGVARELYDFYRLFGGANEGTLMGAGNGLVRSAAWSRIVANIFGMRLCVTDFENAVCGAALCAAEGLKLYRLSDFKAEIAMEMEPDKRESGSL